ncbi:MAG TPA: tyrosine--tRNA ligase [Acidimicrobiales bacterium]|nr:tyrosine--tRNA ligase [Acidimicrobiales bacterium]
MADLAADLEFRGLVHQVSDPGLLTRLDGDRLVVYWGFDPTSDSLHVGNLLQLCNLRRLQEAGHRLIALAGGATGIIGDPGGKSEERNLLTVAEVQANVDAIRPQIEPFLDFSGREGAILVNNGDWLGPVSLLEFLRDVGKHFTVNQMVTKDSVRSRLDREGSGISYTEFSYMLLQAADYLHLFDAYGCRLQVGGREQWGNITAGIDLVRRVRQETVWGLTTPLVLNADGTKFGKTEEGTVWLDARRTSPYQLYQFFLRAPDEDVGAYLRYFTFLDHRRILELDRVTAEHPDRRQGQRTLAHEVVALVHGDAATKSAEQAAAALFGEEVAGLDEATILDVFDGAPSSTFSRTRLNGGVSLVDLLHETGLAASKTRARTTIEQGGAFVNNRREQDVDRRIESHDLIDGRYLVLRRGRREYHLVSFG